MNEKPATRRSIFAVWRWPWWVWCIALSTSFAISYLSAYLILVSRLVSITVQDRGVIARSKPVYSCEAFFPASWKLKIRTFFGPAQQLDRLARPEKWKPQIQAFSPDEDVWDFTFTGNDWEPRSVKFVTALEGNVKYRRIVAPVPAD